jgi:Rps23 Pro-64 3,4-dihydroxylase Tpa1-like proline 4-hydroxylase
MKIYLNKKYDNLDSIAEENCNSYVSAEPFPHIVFDNFFDEMFLNEVLDEFPNDLDRIGGKYSTDQEKKSFSNNPDKLSNKINDFLNFTNSHKFINFINKLSVMERPLIPDPYLFGGGLHELKDGGFLNIHCDFNKHPKMNLDRRINVLIYLNHDWKDEYGGALELWDKNMKSCVQKIQPIFNRMVIFNTTNFSYHGNPDAIKLSDKSKSRKSIALYYYSNGRPSNEISIKDHSTLWKNRPNTSDTLSKTYYKKIFWKLFYKYKI